MSLHRVIGIDFGTCYSAVTAWDPEAARAVIIHDEEFGPTTPSVIGLDPAGNVIIGQAAKRHGPANPANVVIGIKRHMGELFKPNTLPQDNAGQRWTSGEPLRVLFNDHWMLPQELSAFVLMRMKANAERRMGGEIRDAVVTVPACFTANQKMAVEEAVLLAGLHPHQLVPEPTAAVIGYAGDRSESRPHVYLVYRLGGSTFDVSIIRLHEGKVQVVTSAGDPRLGGLDFDDLITRWALKEGFRIQGLDLTNDPFARADLKISSEQAKVRLTASPSTELRITDPRSGRFLAPTLTRELFEQMIDPLLRRSLASVEQAVNDAAGKGVSRDDIDGILLAGGSTKIPLVRKILLEHLGKDETFLRTGADPDLLAARGAATLAQRFQVSGLSPERGRRLEAPETATEVTLTNEQTVGLGVQEGRFDSLIPRGTVIPVSVTRRLTNPEGTVVMALAIYQGEGAYVSENTLVGTLEVGPMQALPAGEHLFEITFSLVQKGLLLVVVEHRNEGKRYVAEFRRPAVVSSGEALDTMRRNQLTRELSLIEINPPAPAVSVEEVRKAAELIDRNPDAIGSTAKAQPLSLDENVQFTVYRPAAVQAGKWYTLLAFAHLSERRPEAPPHEPDPVQEVNRQAASVLADEAGHYRHVTEDSARAVPREGELSFVPEIPGVEFNPPRRTFLWRESVHREEFRMCAEPGMEGQVVRGRLTVFLGSIIIGDVSLSVRVGGEESRPVSATVAAYRKIFASYSHRDLAIVEECERFACAVGDEYVRDVLDLRTGEVWDERLRQMIEDADVFQLFWSRNSMRSDFVRREWEHALALGHKGPAFIRPVYWEEPLPGDPKEDLPPEKLRRLHFQRLSISSEDTVSLSQIRELRSHNYKVQLDDEQLLGAEVKATPLPSLLGRRGPLDSVERLPAPRTVGPDQELLAPLVTEFTALMAAATDGIASTEHFREVQMQLGDLRERAERVSSQVQSEQGRAYHYELTGALDRAWEQLQKLDSEVSDAEEISDLRKQLVSVQNDAQRGIHSTAQCQSIESGLSAIQAAIAEFTNRHQNLANTARAAIDDIEQAVAKYQAQLYEMRDSLADAEFLNPVVGRFNELLRSVHGGIRNLEVLDEFRHGMQSLADDLRDSGHRVHTAGARNTYNELRAAVDASLRQLTSAEESAARPLQPLAKAEVDAGNVKWTGGRIIVLLALSAVLVMSATSWWHRIPWRPLATFVRWSAWILAGLCALGALAAALLSVVSRKRAGAGHSGFPKAR